MDIVYTPNDLRCFVTFVHGIDEYRSRALINGLKNIISAFDPFCGAWHAALSISTTADLLGLSHTAV